MNRLKCRGGGRVSFILNKLSQFSLISRNCQLLRLDISQLVLFHGEFEPLINLTFHLYFFRLIWKY